LDTDLPARCFWLKLELVFDSVVVFLLNMTAEPGEQARGLRVDERVAEPVIRMIKSVGDPDSSHETQPKLNASAGFVQC